MMAAYFIYAAFALGALSLYLLVPRVVTRRAGITAGWLAAIVAGALAVYASRLLDLQAGAMFYFFAIVAVLAAARVITHTKPVYSAVYFVVVVLAVAAVLILQQAEFLAVALIVIYAGAILVTYLFVIMLAQQPGSPVYDRRAREPFWAVLAGFLLVGVIAGQAAGNGATRDQPTAAVKVRSEREPSLAPSAGNTAAIGAALMTRYSVAVEIGGVLLLISMVGAIAISRKRVPTETIRDTASTLGEIGKEVEPF
jgi:NADH-quinone oxidoreductase subunit J